MRNPADADMDNTYMVTVKADDGTYMTSRDVTVRVTEGDDVGTGTLPAGIAKFDTDPQDNVISKNEVIKCHQCDYLRRRSSNHSQE